MVEHALPLGYTLFLWWFSTGVILYLDGLPRRTFPWTMAAASLLALAGLFGLHQTAGDATVAGAYLAFTSALLVWAWHEVSFLLGVLTGPCREPLPAGSRGWSRFGHAVQTILYHEVALALSALLVIALTQGGANQVGAWTFLVLWVMRLSAKLNLFLGVRNTAAELLPEHLRYLATFFRRRRMNPLFPVSMLAATALAAWLVSHAAAAGATAFAAVGTTFVAALLVLAILEHWLLVLPIRAEAMWAWSLRSRGAQSGAAGGAT